MTLRISSNSCRLAARWATPATFANSVSNLASTSVGGTGGRTPASVEVGAKVPARDKVWSKGRPKAIRIRRIKSSRCANPNTSRNRSIEGAATQKRHIVHQPAKLSAVTITRRKLPPQAQNCTITHCSGIICQNLEIYSRLGVPPIFMPRFADLKVGARSKTGRLSQRLDTRGQICVYHKQKLSEKLCNLEGSKVINYR